MSVPRIKLVVVGDPTFTFDRARLRNWKSAVFSLLDDIETHPLRVGPDTGNNYSDDALKRAIPAKDDADCLLAIVSVPLKDFFYIRILDNNRVVLSYFGLKELLDFKNIPIENLVLRSLYEGVLIYYRSKRVLPLTSEAAKYTHAETRKCLFDYTAYQYEVVHSCDQPILCDQCEHALLGEGVSKEKIQAVRSEIKEIKRDAFYYISDYVKKHPIRALLLSSLWALVIGILAGLIVDGFH